MPKRRRGIDLVLDDWYCGYSIRKVKFPFPSASGEGADEPQRLPRPLMRLMAHRGLPDCFTNAFGTKIIGLHPSRTHIQIIDVHTRSIIIGPKSNYPAFPIYFPIGEDKLIAMDAGSVELLRMPLKQPTAKPDSSGSPRDQSDSSGYDSDIDNSDLWWWQQLPTSPFSRLQVTSYAMHSDGVTILFSTNGDKGSGTFTFTFDTGKFVWTLLGEWRLPFTGRGHFDPDLHALVGLSKDPENLGYLFACDVPSSSNRRCHAPAWKRSKEKVFSNDPADRHVGATLVYMGCRRKFCLVECVSVEVKEDDADQMLPLEKPGGVTQRSRYMYRLMTFSLKYDKMDNLRVKHSQVQYYKVPKKVTDPVCADPVAFCSKMHIMS